MAGFHLRRKCARNRPQRHSSAYLDGRASVHAVPTRPQIAHKGAFVPIFAARNVPKKHTQRHIRSRFGRPQRTQKSYPTVPRRSPPGRDSAAGRPFAFLSDRTKAVPRSRRRPLYPTAVRGAEAPPPKLGPAPPGRIPPGQPGRAEPEPDTARRSAGRTRGLYGPASLARAGRPIRVSAGSNAARKSAMISTALGSSRPLRAGRVGVRTPRQAEPEPDTDLRTTLAPAPAGIASRLYSRTPRHGTARRQKIQSTRHSACLPPDFVSGFGFAYAVAPWPVAPWHK